MPQPPYKLAKLINSDKPLTTRWYIEFYVWNALEEKLARKRDYAINRHKTRQERLNFAKKRIREIDGLLASGHVMNAKQKKEEKTQIFIDTTRDYTIAQAFTYITPIIKNTMRPDSVTSYLSVGRMFENFCRLTGWINWKIVTLQQHDIISFLDWLQAENGISNTTRNKYMSMLAAIFTIMKSRKILKENVAHGIKSLRQDEGKNTPYTNQQIAVLKPKLQTGNMRLWYFVTFLLYGFMRPKEIARLQVKMIDLNNNVINLPASCSKNRRNRCIRISPAWRTYIDQLNLYRYPPNDYVFGYCLNTGSKPMQRNFATSYHTKIARALDFDADYTLYSWKHTGVCLHYMAGVDIKTLQAQIGHQSLEETDNYLRSLNLYQGTEMIDKSPVI